MARRARLWHPTAKDRETAKAMAAAGIAQDRIAALLRITDRTLRKHLRHELDVGMAEANAAVAASMYRMATKGPYSVRFVAARYWLACRAGGAWRDGDKQMVLVPMAAYEMSDDQLREVIEREETYQRECERVAANGGAVVAFPGAPQRRRCR